MTATELRERLESIQQDVRTGERHADTVIGPLREAVRAAQIAEEQSLCTHELVQEKIMGSYIKKWCASCLKPMRGEDIR